MAVAEKTKTLTRFQVVEGIHYQLTAEARDLPPHDPGRFKVLKKGDTIQSELDLEAKYVNKFRRVPDHEGPVSDERKLEVEELIGKSEWNESERSFLEGLTEDRFEKIKRISSAKPAPEPVKKANSMLGEDVTDSFQRAYDEGFKVFRNPAGKYQVSKPNQPNKPVNKEPLEQAGVDKFVDMLIKEK